MVIDYVIRVIESIISEGGLKYELFFCENFMWYNIFMLENNKEFIFVVKIMVLEKLDYWNFIGGMYFYVG